MRLTIIFYVTAENGMLNKNIYDTSHKLNKKILSVTFLFFITADTS